MDKNNNQTNNIQEPKKTKEKKKNDIFLWWGNLNKGVKTTLCILGGVVIATSVVVPTIIGAKSCQSEKKTVIIDSNEVQSSSSFESDGSLKANIKPISDTKEIERVEIKIGDYTLQPNEYTFDKNTGDIIIPSNILKAHKGNIIIKPTLKDKTPTIKVTSVTITNTSILVGTDEELELTAAVLPENATNKELDWSITTGPSNAEIVKKDNKVYLKGKNYGKVTVKAAAKDGSGKDNSKEFSVFSSFLDYVQVETTDTCLVKSKEGKTLPQNIVIPEKDLNNNRTVIGVASNGFGKGTGVKSITFEKSDNITTISDNAFKDNNSLTSFEVPKNVEVIGDNAFSFNESEAGTTRSLTSVTFESNSKLNTIGKSAFEGQTSLTSIVIPNKVEVIEEKSFYNTGLTSATLENNSIWLTKDESEEEKIWVPSTTLSENATKLKESTKQIIKSTITITGVDQIEPQKTATYTLPEGITASKWVSTDTTIATVDNNGTVTAGITNKDFYLYITTSDGKFGAKKISVYINDDYFMYTPILDGEGKEIAYSLMLKHIANPPENFVIPSYHLGLPVTEINGSMYTINLFSSLVIPSTVKKINSYAFYNNSILKSITFNEGLEEIGENAFSQCGIESITLPSSLKYIKSYAFSQCYSLASINLNEGLEEIGEHAFDSCSSESITFPSTLKYIKSYAFYQCSDLSSINLNEGLEEIGEHAFDGCTKITSTVALPSSITSIGTYALYFGFNQTAPIDASALNSATQCSIGENAFGLPKSGIILSYSTIYVKSTLVDAFKTSWSAYSNQIEAKS